MFVIRSSLMARRQAGVILPDVRGAGMRTARVDFFMGQEL